jgi:hypothetical protein
LASIITQTRKNTSMKRTSLLLAALLSIGLAACGEQQKPAPAKAPEAPAKAPEAAAPTPPADAAKPAAEAPKADTAAPAAAPAPVAEPTKEEKK